MMRETLSGLVATIMVMAASLTFARIEAQAQTTPQDPAPSIAGTVTVNTREGQSIELPGITVSLSHQPPDAVTQSTVTDEAGHYRFTGLPAGTYRLEVSQDGFEPSVHIVVLESEEGLIKNIPLEIQSFTQEVEVRGDMAEVATQHVGSTTSITSAQIATLPLAEAKLQAALPLVPGVVRTEDGKLNIKGAPENQGMLLVDSARNVDPVTGSFSIPIPLDAIETVSVSKAAYSAEYGGFSGGLTRIETKPPAERWQYGIYDFIPGVRGKNGNLVGLSGETPRLYFGGPLLKDKVNFSEAVTYDFKRNPVRGLAWPNNETTRRGFATLTSLQAILSPRHLLNVQLNAFSNRQQFANINSLVSQTASSDVGQHGISVGANDSYEFGSGLLLSTVFRYTRFDSNAYGQGSQDMLITPEGWGGNFFNSWARTSNQFEVLPTLRFPSKSWHGNHKLMVGADITRRSFDETNASHPVRFLREDGSLAEQMDFQAGGNLHGSDTEASEFIQDHWTVNDRLALDLGTRMLSQSAGRSAAFAPRAGASYSLSTQHKTVIHAGSGLFYASVPLLATNFIANPTRIVSNFDSTGKLSGTPVPIPNVYLQSTAEGGLVPTDKIPHSSARNFTWNVEVDREISRATALRVSYLSSKTRNLAVITPVSGLSGGRSVLGLSNTGTSHYHEFQATLHYQASHKELSVSYIRSYAHGDLNTLSDIYVPFEQAVIRPNAATTLAADIPNRVVAWGSFSMPGRVTFSPVVDVHSGLPYSRVDAIQNYVGTPDTERFPYFFSFDFKLYREFNMPFLSSHKNRRLRLGIYSLNATNHNNPRDVFNNVTSLKFGQFAGFQHRVNGFVIDVVN